jgi:hypothetical protein
VIIGDHGMAEVRGTVDVAAALAAAGLKQRDGFVAFLDSTIARFWVSDASVAPRLRRTLDSLAGGRCLTRAERNVLHLNHRDARLGDLTFLTDPHMLISPNFYQREPVRGMHGYAPDVPDQQSAFIVVSPLVNRPRRVPVPLDMRRIYPTLLQLLGIPAHGNARSQSILDA